MACDRHLKAPPRMSATLAINTEVRRRQAAGERVFHLGFGESRFPVQSKVLTALRENATERSYLPVAGLPELRDAVAGYYRRRFGLDAEASQVIVGTGSKCLLYAALQAVDGDVILPAPSWVSYETQAGLAGKGVTWARTSLDRDYCLTGEELLRAVAEARAAGQSPSILVLNTPNNPTSVMYPPELLAEIAEVARAEELLIVSDEIYALTAHGHTDHVSMAIHYPEGTIVTGGLSKHLSLGGWRLGVAVLPPGELGEGLFKCIAGVAGSIWTTPTAPVQHAAVVAYSDDAEIDAYVRACAEVHGVVTGYLHERLTAAGVPCPRPAAGFYLYPSFAPWRESLVERFEVTTSEGLAQLLLKEQSIAALPGSCFGADPTELTLRLSTSCLMPALDDPESGLLGLHARGVSREELFAGGCPDLPEVGSRFGRFVESLVEQPAVVLD